MVCIELLRRLCCPPITPEVEVDSTELHARFSFAWDTAKDRGPRDYMEDMLSAEMNCFGHKERSGVCGVFDGHGGDFVSCTASHMIPKGLADSCGGALPNDPTETICELMQRADECLLESPIAKHCGSTMCLVIVDGDRLHCANAGDSRAVLSRGGEAVELSRLHTPYDAVEAERVRNSGGVVKIGQGGVSRCYTAGGGGGLAVTRGLGDGRMKRPCKVMTSVPEVQSFNLIPEDEFVILGTDGLFDVVTPTEAVNAVRRANPNTPKEAAQLLLRMARKRRSTDNVGIGVLFLGSGPVHKGKAAAAAIGAAAADASTMSPGNSIGESSRGLLRPDVLRSEMLRSESVLSLNSSLNSEGEGSVQPLLRGTALQALRAQMQQEREQDKELGQMRDPPMNCDYAFPSSSSAQVDARNSPHEQYDKLSPLASQLSPTKGVGPKSASRLST